MRKIYRVMDANLNRAREGLRVLEEAARFILDDQILTAELKDLRHLITGLAASLPGGAVELVEARDTKGDVGAGSWSEGERTRDSVYNLVQANFKRVQEAARVLEEFGKMTGPGADKYKKVRYELYVLEQKMLDKIKKMDAPG